MDASSVDIVRRVLETAPLFSNVYLRGSHLYGTADEKSDIDIFVVCPPNCRVNETDNLDKLAGILRTQGIADIDHVGNGYFNQMLADHDVAAVEMYLCKQSSMINCFQSLFVLDKAQLRRSFSHVVSNSWVKAKKKLTVEADFDERVARKSLFHSFRILDFGIQIASGLELDVTSVNNILAEINSLPADWKILDERFRERHNEMQSYFRKICPK